MPKTARDKLDDVIYRKWMNTLNKSEEEVIQERENNRENYSRSLSGVKSLAEQMEKEIQKFTKIWIELGRLRDAMEKQYQDLTTKADVDEQLHDVYNNLMDSIATMSKNYEQGRGTVEEDIAYLKNRIENLYK